VDERLVFVSRAAVDVLLVNSREYFDDEVFCCKDESANVVGQPLTTSAATNDVQTRHTDCNVPELRTSPADGDSCQPSCLDGHDVTDGSSREPWTSSAGGSQKSGVERSASDVSLHGQKDQADYERQLEENEVGDVVDQLQQPGSSRKIDVGASGTLSSSPPTGHMLMSARRIPKAAVALLRFPYDSIRRELDSTGTSGGDENSPGLAETPPLAQTTSASSSARTDAATVPATAADCCATPPATTVHQGGLMSRTLGSISSLPSSLVDLSSSLFVRGSGSDGGAPSPPRSALLDKTTTGATAAPGGGGAAGERSPGPTHSSPRTFLFQPLERLVWGSKAGQGDAETADSGALPNDGKLTV
jgi:hypothetical protein